MLKKSSGILLCCIKKKMLHVLLFHPGGPNWINIDDGSWSIPNGEFTEEENPLEAEKENFLKKPVFV